LIHQVRRAGPDGSRLYRDVERLKGMIIAGVDIGSTTSKAVLLDDQDQILAFRIIATGFDRNQSGEEVLEQALQEAGLRREDVSCVASTGYGRRSLLSAEKVWPEIICHAKGTFFLYPGVKTIIDIGGQDSKVIEMNGQGTVQRFEMNDKCAAGTGRFFEVLTGRLLGIPLDELGPLALQSTEPSPLSTMCTIFAESEIISLLSTGTPKEDIAAGMHRAVAKRVVCMGKSGQISFPEPIIFSGGVAKNVDVTRAFEEILRKKVQPIERPQITAALGVALLAKQELTAAGQRVS
jgi:predicted CoA-substrate-specific enzyme activase